MRWTYANSRVALTLRRRLARYGVGTPAVAVRTRLPAPWRILGLVALVSVSLAGAAWIYDAGRRYAGFDRDQTEQELLDLRRRAATLDQELGSLRAAADSSTSALQIERTTQERLTQKVRELESENARLRQDLAFFESLAEGPRRENQLSISRLEVQPDAIPGAYRYRLLVVMQGGKLRDFDGSMQFVVTVEGARGPERIVVPRPDDPDKQRFRIHFRHFKRLDGAFKIPEGSRVSAVEVRLIQDGATRASQSLTM